MSTAKNIVDELNIYRASQFTFYDDALDCNKQEPLKICDEIHRRGLKIKWNSWSSLNQQRTLHSGFVWALNQAPSKKNKKRETLSLAQRQTLRMKEETDFNDCCWRRFWFSGETKERRLRN